MIRVIHIKDADFSDPTHVYVGRKNGKLKESPLANPFTLHNETNRGKVIDEYKDWLFDALQAESPQLKELRRLIGIHNENDVLNIVCYCAPRACHGDIIKLAIESEMYDDYEEELLVETYEHQRTPY